MAADQQAVARRTDQNRQPTRATPAAAQDSKTAPAANAKSLPAARMLSTANAVARCASASSAATEIIKTPRPENLVTGGDTAQTGLRAAELRVRLAQGLRCQRQPHRNWRVRACTTASSRETMSLQVRIG